MSHPLLPFGSAPQPDAVSEIKLTEAKLATAPDLNADIAM